MALTVTATKKIINPWRTLWLYQVIHLRMNNILYTAAPKIDLVNFLSDLCSDLRHERVNSSKTTIFARLYDCAMLTTMQRQMKSEIFKPIGTPNMGRFLLVDVFTRVNTEKKQILQFFTVPKKHLVWE